MKKLIVIIFLISNTLSVFAVDELLKNEFREHAKQMLITTIVPEKNESIGGATLYTPATSHRELLDCSSLFIFNSRQKVIVVHFDSSSNNEPAVLRYNNYTFTETSKTADYSFIITNYSDIESVYLHLEKFHSSVTINLKDGSKYTYFTDGVLFPL